MQRPQNGVERGVVHDLRRLGAVQSVGEFVERGLLVRARRQRRFGALAFLLGAFAVGNIKDRRDPSDHLAVLIPFRRIDHVHEPRADALVVNLSFALDTLAVEDSL